MLRSLLVLSILVPGLVAALASSYWALLMYLWFALFRPQDWLWIDITSLRVSMVLGVMLMLTAGRARFDQGLSGAFVDNNGYALGTVMIMPLLLVSAQNIDLVYSGPLLKWIRRAFYASVPLCAFTVIGTYSRGGFVA